MVNASDSIRFTNVISRKYRFHYKEMNDWLEGFMKDIIQQNVTIKGPLFYSIQNVPMDEMVHAEFFMPVEEDSLTLREGMYFHSYFSIEDMISVCVFKDFEKNIEVAYKVLLDYIEHNEWHQVTPIFHVISGDQSLPYLFVKIGVSRGEEFREK